MRLIDVLRQQYGEFSARGARAASWKLDHAAIAQLRREAAEDGTDVSSVTTPPTFLGVPIEEVPMGAAQADFVASHCRFAPCQRLDREQGRQWDIFDLDAGQPLGAFYGSKAEANAAAIKLDIERA